MVVGFGYVLAGGGKKVGFLESILSGIRRIGEALLLALQTEHVQSLMLSNTSGATSCKKRYCDSIFQKFRVTG